jgi:sulfonate transport system permease protein
MTSLSVQALAARPPETEPREARPRWKPRRHVPYATAIGPLLLLALWAVASATQLLDPHVLSAPWTVFETGCELWRSGKLQAHLLTSAARAAIGLSIGVGLGTACALLAGLTRTGDALLDGSLQLKRSVPNVALIPSYGSA